MSIDDFESIEEALAILSEPESMARLNEGILEAQNGEFATDNDLRALHERFGTARPAHLG